MLARKGDITASGKSILTHNSSLLDEHEYRSLYETLQDVFYRTDNRGVIVKVSPYIYKAMGYTPEEFLGTNIADHYVDPADREQIWEHIFSDGFVEDYEVRFRRKDGSTIWASTNGRPYYDAKGGFTGLEGTVRDISEYKRLQACLLQREAMLRAQYRAIPVPTITWRFKNEDLVMEDFNQAAAEISSGRIGRLIGSAASELYRDQPQILAAFWKAYDNKCTLQDELPYRFLSTGDFARIILSCVFIEPDMLMIHITDITERYCAREQLKRSQRHLRTLSAQLLQAKEEERRRISSDLHDSVGQYLATIKLHTECFLRRGEKLHPDISHSELQDQITLIQTTIDEVRRISMDLRPAMLDELGLLSTITWFCREFSNTHEHIRLRWNLNVAEDRIKEHLKITIFRILQESLHNIAKHSRSSSAEVSLTEENHLIELCVSDNGCGFNVQEMLARDDMQRGLGLASMKERTEFSGGVFYISSQKGAGTTLKASWVMEQPI